MELSSPGDDGLRGSVTAGIKNPVGDCRERFEELAYGQHSPIGALPRFAQSSLSLVLATLALYQFGSPLA